MKDNWREEYKKRYKELKEKGKSFFPYTVFKDTVAAFLILAALGFLAYFVGAGLEDLADPTDTTYNPRPEWYFLFLFQALKFFPGHLEALAAVVLPGLALALLVLLPFLDRGPKRHLLDRPLWTGLGALALAVIAYLTWEGYRSPLTNPIIEKDPAVLAGRRLYQELNCFYCHQLAGKGGVVGPALDVVGRERPENWVADHLRNPQGTEAGSAMPNLHLLEEEIVSLTAYLKSVAGGGPFTKEAPNLFSENCAACHRIGPEGGDSGPDLTLIGSARDKDYIKRYILDPAKLNPSAVMPGFKDQLPDDSVEDLARYLAAQKQEERLFTEEATVVFSKHCASCHSVEGHGGTSGPDLTLIGTVRDKSFLKKYIENPASINPTSVMPSFHGQLTDIQIEDLTRYLTSLKKAGAAKKKGAVLATHGYQLYRDLKCGYCHQIGGKGGRVGPSLDRAVKEKTTEWVRQHLRDPQALTVGSAMPKFRLSDEEIEALAAYLKSL